MKNFLLLILFIFSCTPTEPEDKIEDASSCGGPYGHDCGDYKLLEQFIELNSQIFRHYLDINENGIVEAMEFGYQVWDYPGSGRLIWLDLNYPKDIIMKQDNPSELDLTNYRLTVIPYNIGDLNKLESLFLHDNEFTSIPESIGNLTKLKMLDLENNFITEIPDEIGSLINLKNLVLDFNYLNSIPQTIGSLSSLVTLEIRSNNLENLPGSIGNLSQLEWLYLNDNILTSLPDSIGALETLKMLDIRNNMLSSLPDNICEIYPGQWNCEEDSEGMCIGSEICTTSPKCLEILSIGNNELCEDGIPSCIDQNIGSQNCANCDPWEFNIEGYCADSTDYNILQNFLDLNAYSQSLPYSTGIPDKASECVNTDWWDNGRLIEITFYSKILTSEIPANFGMLDSLEILDLHDNDLTGEIPLSIANLTNLQKLKLNSNSLIGSIPDSIDHLVNLDTLWLNDNNLSGEIPQSISSLDRLQHLRLDGNNLYGPIPGNIGDLSSIKYLRLDNNNFSGGLPPSIGNLINIKRLYILNNHLSGQIPDSICALYTINNNFSLYLHNNRFCPGTEGYPECLNDDHIGHQNTSECVGD